MFTEKIKKDEFQKAIDVTFQGKIKSHTIDNLKNNKSTISDMNSNNEKEYNVPMRNLVVTKLSCTSHAICINLKSS